MDFLNRAKQRGAWEFFALGAYTLLVGAIELHHKPWADEAQAWMIARNCSLSEIFLKRLHYEGTPGLWHLLLWLMIRAHVSYAGMHWIVVGVGVATAYVLVRLSPFPLWIRLLLPFSFAFTFLTAIIARSYSLVPLLVFAICILLTGKRDRPVLFAVLAGLLANTAVFSALLSAGFLVLYLRRRAFGFTESFSAPAGGTEQSGPVPVRAERRSKLVPAAAVLLVFWGIAVYTAMPAPDVSFGKFGQLVSAHPFVAQTLATFTGIPAPSPLELHLAKIASVAKPVVVKPALSPPIEILLLVVIVLSIAFFAASSSNLVAVCFYGLLIACLYRRRRMAAALPLALILVGGALIGFTEHHLSLVWAAVVAAAWIGFAGEPAVAEKPWLRLCFLVLFMLVTVEQFCWTLVAANAAYRTPFSGSQDAARFIASVVRAKPIAAFGFYAVAPQPYFPHPVFFNQPNGYWLWSTIGSPDLMVREIVARRPPYIVYGDTFMGNAKWQYQILPKSAPVEQGADGIAAYITAHGYSETHRFCGKQPAHFGYSEETCQEIYEPRGN